MSDPRTKSHRPASIRRYFTVEEANARLPLVRAITTDMVELFKDLIERQQRLESLLDGRKLDARDAYSQELTEMVKSVERDKTRLDEYVAELAALGVEAKGAMEGLVDFPAMVDGREVYLCWRLGETEVSHWHEMDAGFAGRKPLALAASLDDAI